MEAGFRIQIGRRFDEGGKHAMVAQTLAGIYLQRPIRQLDRETGLAGAAFATNEDDKSLPPKNGAEVFGREP